MPRKSAAKKAPAKKAPAKKAPAKKAPAKQAKQKKSGVEQLADLALANGGIKKEAAKASQPVQNDPNHIKVLGYSIKVPTHFSSKLEELHFSALKDAHQSEQNSQGSPAAKMPKRFAGAHEEFHWQALNEHSQNTKGNGKKETTGQEESHTEEEEDFDEETEEEDIEDEDDYEL